MEYIAHGDLMNLLIKEGQFSESVSQFFVAEILLGLEYVHAKGFIHRFIFII